MEQTQPTTAETVVESQPTGVPKEEAQLATIVYVLQALSLFVGLTSIAGVILNYVKRGSLQSEVVQSHFSFQIRTFWWTVLWSILALIATTITFGIGGFTFLIVIVWYVYRVVKGWIRLNDQQPI